MGLSVGKQIAAYVSLAQTYADNQQFDLAINSYRRELLLRGDDHSQVASIATCSITLLLTVCGMWPMCLYLVSLLNSQPIIIIVIEIIMIIVLHEGKRFMYLSISDLSIIRLLVMVDLDWRGMPVYWSVTDLVQQAVCHG